MQLLMDQLTEANTANAVMAEEIRNPDGQRAAVLTDRETTVPKKAMDQASHSTLGETK